MLDHEDLKWIASTTTELNSMLQQISRYSDLARQHNGEHNYIEMLGERVELAAKTTQAIFDRVTSSILAGRVAPPPAARTQSHPPFSIVPPPEPAAKVDPKPASAPAEKVPAVTVPMKQPLPVLPPEFQIVNPNGRRELILFVDDDAEVAEIAADMLADEGYKVVRARDGFEALTIYRAIGHEIGLVILDFFLPVLDGDAVFDELKSLNSDVGVVLSSGFAEQTKLGGMLARGLRGFIPKPYTREKLLSQVRSTLDSDRQSIA